MHRLVLCFGVSSFLSVYFVFQHPNKILTIFLKLESVQSQLEGISCFRCYLSHSLCKHILKCTTVQFSFQNFSHILSWAKVTTTSRTIMHLLLPQPCYCNVCKMWFCIVLLKNEWMRLEKILSQRHCLLLFSIDAAFTEV